MLFAERVLQAQFLSKTPRLLRIKKLNGENDVKIIELRAENFKRLKAVRVRPDGAVVQVTGRNGAGKTSVLDAIAAAVDAAALSLKMPVRKGEKKASLFVDLGDLRVTRTFTLEDDGKTSSKLLVESRDGFRAKNPQTTLDELMGKLTLDPLEFMRAKPEVRVGMIRSLVPGFDFAKNAGAEKEARDKRTDVNRVLKARVAARASVKLPDGPRPERPDTAALTRQLEEADARNDRIRDQAASRARYAEKTDAMIEEAADLRGRADALDRAVAERRKQVEALPPLDDTVDTALIRNELRDAAATAERCALHERAEQLDADLTKFSAQLESLSEEILRLADERSSAVASAALPEGVKIEDGAVTMSGVPFEQASAAEQLRVSTSIAMALNPKLRIILMRDGSLLDADGVRTIAEMADKNDFQVWLERVASGERAGVLIEDGEVAP